MTKEIRAPLLACIWLLLAATILSLGWRLADPAPGDSGNAASMKPTKGPVDPAFCGPLQRSLPPPPIDSPFGHHLYPDTPKAGIRQLAVIEAAARLVRETQPPRTQPEHAESEHAAHDDVQTVVLLLEEYRRVFGAMPQGELNEEIVRRLQGENPLGIAVLPKGHPNLSPGGELLDRWGTPYRFHPESAWLTTVRSAGPDREMWTADDLLSEAPDDDRVLTAGF